MEEEFQSSENGGIALCPMRDGSVYPRDVAVHYEVKVVDCDPKPSKKLRKRDEVESKFQLLSENQYYYSGLGGRVC